VSECDEDFYAHILGISTDPCYFQNLGTTTGSSVCYLRTGIYLQRQYVSSLN